MVPVSLNVTPVDRKAAIGMRLWCVLCEAGLPHGEHRPASWRAYNDDGTTLGLFCNEHVALLQTRPRAAS